MSLILCNSLLIYFKKTLTDPKKARVYQGTFIEFGIGFVEKQGTFEPWMVLNVGGAASKFG